MIFQTYIQLTFLEVETYFKALSKSKTVQSVMMISSANVYGNNSSEDFVTEQSKLGPINDYAISKPRGAFIFFMGK